MRNTVSLFLLAVLTLSGRALVVADGAGAALGSNVSIVSATLSINGTSTMHPYTVSTRTLKVTAAVAAAEDVGGLLQPDALTGFVLDIPVASFTSDKDGLTKQMFKALKSDKHPVITFRLTGYSPERGPAGTSIKANGTLTVAGVERPIDVVLAVKEQAGALHIRGTRDLLMTDFGIKPPTMFMGMLKTDDKVTITFDLQLSLAPQAQASKGL